MALTIRRKAYTAIFHRPYYKSEHHRNPSGLHNKVNYLLVNSERDKEKLKDLIECRWDIDFSTTEESRKSWALAYEIAEAIIEGNKEICARFPKYWLIKMFYRK